MTEPTPRPQGAAQTRGASGPQQPEPSDNFKKIMAVDESGSAEQQDRRPTSKLEESADDQENQQVTTPSGNFSALLEDDKSASVDNSPRTQSFTIKESPGDKAAVIHESSKTHPKLQAAAPLKIQGGKKVNTKVVPSKAKTKPKESSPPPASLTPALKKERPQKVKETPKTTETEPTKKATAPEKPKEKEKKSLEKLKPETPLTTQESAIQPEGAPTPIIASPTSFTPLSQTETISALSFGNISKQSVELVTKMAAMITFAQIKGVSSTKMTLDMPNSPFNGASIRVDFYDTAPFSFNLQLAGSPQAIALFEANQGSLLAILRETHPNFQINFLKPILSETTRKPSEKERVQSTMEDGKQDKGTF